MAEIIARAVHHIHRSGLLHLDLKPSNILLDGDGGAGWDGLVPKVTDFGIARAVDAAATDTGGAVLGGTPSYMAPEQITSPRKDMTAAADIHGLGAILYHMLTGRPPYQGATLLETIDQVQRQDTVPPRRIRAGNPARPRDHLPEMPSQGPGPALRLRRGAGRRLEPLARRTADRGAAGFASGEELALVPPPAGDRALVATLVITLSVSLAAVVALWRRAEANYRMSNEILGELIDLSIGGETDSPGE